MSAKKPAGLWWVRLLYLVVYSAYGTTSVYRTLYFRRVGLDGTEIGALIAAQPLVMLLAGPLWSLIADRLGLRARLLTLVTGLSILPTLGMAGVTGFGPLMVLNILYALFLGPIQPLMDSTALEVLGSDRHQYATVRAFGSLGYAPVAWITGLAIERIDIRWIFGGYALLMGAGCLLSVRVRSEQPHLRAHLGRGLGTLIQDAHWRLFMLAVFIALIAQGVTFGYAALYLDTLGASEGLIGFSGTLGSLGQTLLMLGVLPRLLRRWGSQRLMVVALLTYTVRCAIWALLPVPGIVAASELLLGLTYGSVLVASVDYADRRAPPGMAATSQAIVTSLVSGLGRSLGSMTAGPLYDRIGPQQTFGLYAGLCLLATLFFGSAWRSREDGYDASRTIS